MSIRRPLVAGNWKMNGLKGSLKELGAIVGGYDASLRAGTELLVCPPATILMPAAVVALGSRVAIGAQDCHPEASGAFTGSLSADMVADCGGTYVIVGHSERRAEHAESDALVRRKALAARRAGLTAIICVGETLDQRQAGQTLSVVTGQVRGSIPPELDASTLVVAYEPVWAIGTGHTPTPKDVAEVHAAIRAELKALLPEGGDAVRILYGGSVKPANAAELLAIPDVDGALVGGASLLAADFLAIASVYRH